MEPWNITIDTILSGSQNSLLKSRAVSIKTLNGKVMLRFAHDMNGNWYGWDGFHNDANTAATAKYVAAYRHVHDVFAAADVTNALWVFCPNVDDGWMSTLKRISGSDAVLAAGIYGFKFVNAAEILRYTNSGWTQSGIDQSTRVFKDTFYPVIQDFATYANGNWTLACVKTMLAIGVFTDDHAMFDRAVNWYYSGTDNGTLTHYIINDTGQCQESGRDQTHTQLGLGFMAEASEIGWHQGLDMYGADDNWLLKGFEYTASTTWAMTSRSSNTRIQPGSATKRRSRQRPAAGG